MSSVTSSYAQIAGRTKFLLVVGADISGYVVDGLQTVTTVDPATAAGRVEVLVGGLLKDLGRQIIVFSATLPGAPVLAIYRQVLPIDGLDTEGVGDTPCVYVRVFSADGTGVSVVRTG